MIQSEFYKLISFPDLAINANDRKQPVRKMINEKWSSKSGSSRSGDEGLVSDLTDQKTRTKMPKTILVDVGEATIAKQGRRKTRREQHLHPPLKDPLSLLRNDIDRVKCHEGLQHRKLNCQIKFRDFWSIWNPCRSSTNWQLRTVTPRAWCAVINRNIFFSRSGACWPTGFCC